MLEQRTITEPRAADAFANARQRGILFALMQTERSLLELQSVLGLSLSLLHYHVAKLIHLDLVQVVRRDPRAGRAIAIYATTAHSFVVPGELSSLTPGKELKAELDAALDRARTRSPGPGTLYNLDDEQNPRRQRMAESAEASSGEWWWRLRLSERDARELAREIREVAARYRRGADSAEQEFLCHFAIAER